MAQTGGVGVKLLPFYYYPFAGAMPILAEIDQDGYVYMSHNDQVLHRAKYRGEFVPLVEFHGNVDPLRKTSKEALDG